MNKKVAIMTWHTYNNYGGVLQAYALRKKIQDLGCEKVDFINYFPTGRSMKLSEKLAFKNIYEILLRKFCKQELDFIRNQKFDDFRNSNITCTKLCDNKMDLYSLNSEYDKFICGSDQIWAPTVFDENYFLKFVNNDDKKIAYAPSIGLDSVEDEVVKKQMKELISKFRNLSIREEKGRQIIKDLTESEAKIVLDPTLLLDKKEWNNIFDLGNFYKKDYVLVYCLGEASKAYKLAKKFNKEIIFVPKNYADYSKYKKNVFIPSPIEFLKLIYNADMVITDSFHGTIFSMNFNVPFITLKRFKDNNVSQNSRIYSILKMTELEDRLFNGDINYFISNTKINFEKTNTIIEQKRKESLEFLSDALSSENKKENENDLITNVCAGCGVCVAVCPQKCIDIKLNEDGFYEYVKDESKCTHCNLCKKVCAQVNSNNIELKNKKLFSFYSKDENVLLKSSSGGFAYEISRWGLENGYKVVGCTYDYELKKAKHIIIDKVEDLEILSGSKYIQSYTKEAFEKILEVDKAIVIGTPCQIASLDNLLKLKNRRNNFVLIDLICHGVPSYLLWDKYLQTKNDITNVKFRDKKFGWRVMAITTDGKILEKENESLFYKFFLIGNIYDESCYECKYRVTSCADIRIGDFWGPKFADNKTGVSMVIPCTDMGTDSIKSMREKGYGVFAEEDISNYLTYQQTQNVKAPFNRKHILQDMKNENGTLKYLSNKYCKPYKKEKKQTAFIMKIYNCLKKIYNFFMKRGNK